ncbi:MAG: outer membrane beta-barrel protein [bacterium]|nr:hypothetical protein [Gammaproteobacteria bacterium]
MKLNRFLITLMALLGSFSVNALEQDGLSGNGATGVFLNLDTSYSVDDNVFLLSSSALDDSILRVSPSARFVGKSGMNTYSVLYNGEKAFYDNFDSESYYDQRLGGIVNFDFSGKTNLTLDASFADLHDDRGTGGSEGDQARAGEPDEYDLLKYGFDFKLGTNTSRFQGQVRADVADKEYTNNREVTFDRDFERTTYGGAVFYNLSTQSALLFEVIAGDIEYDSLPSTGFTLDSEETAYLVGFQWEIGAKTTGHVKVGQQDKKFDDPAREDQDGSSWNVAANWSPRTYTTFTLGTSRAFRETNGFGDDILSTSYDVSWQYVWNSRFLTNLKYAYIEDEEQPTARVDETNRFDFNAVYNFRRWMDIEFDAAFADRKSNATLIPYDRTIYTLSVNLGI